MKKLITNWKQSCFQHTNKSGSGTELDKVTGARKALIAAGLLLLGSSSVFGQSFNLDQASNGKFSDNPRVVAWQNGNLNYQNSHFLETYSIPYRTTIEGLTAGTQYTLLIGYDIREGGYMGLDYLTSTERLDPHNQFGHAAETIDPLLGLTASFKNAVNNIGTPSLFNIPEPTTISTKTTIPAGASLSPHSFWTGIAQAKKQMKLYGGTLNTVNYDVQGNTVDQTSETIVYVTFTANGTKAVLTWGANIAGEVYWGTGTSAKYISGSPYHMRLKGFKTGGHTVYPNGYTSLGNTDRSLKTDAIIQPPSCSLNANSASICAGNTASFTVTASGGAGAPYTYSWTGPGSFSANTATITVSAAGTYTATVTDKIGLSSSGCGAVVSVTSTATATVNAVGPLCQGANNTTVFSVSGTYSNGTPTWTSTGGTVTNPSYVSGVATATITVTGAGPATATLTTVSPNSSCPSATDSKQLVINPVATANAGSDQTVCSSSPNVTLAGQFGGGASSASWSGGAGTYNPNANTLTAVYTPSAAEITAGTVTLTLTTNDPTGPCPAVSDNMIITINPAATVNAGNDQTVCSSSPNVTLAGQKGGGATSVTWSGGAGTFNPNANTLNAVYTPSAAEITAGTVTLTLTTNDPAGPCDAVNDNMIITINPAATVNAGNDQTVCSSAPNVTLAGSFGGGASSANWSGGAGAFNPNANTLNAVYTPSAAEITAGTVTLTLTTNDPTGPCPSVNDNMTITINPAATVNAGNDRTVCSSSPNVVLAGQIGGGATSATWSGGAGNFNPNANSLTATYTPSAAEITAGTVTLTLTTNDPTGPCPSVNDNMTITINPAATVNAGNDQTVCSSSPNVTLAGQKGGGATSVTWSGGAGTFNPNANTLNAVYTPSAAEITAGTVTLTLTTNDPAGPCDAVNDNMIITINPAATVNAGNDQTVCSTSPNVTLAGQIGGGATSATWSGGAGTFNPNVNTLNAVYTPSAAEITVGTVTLTLTTNDPTGPCPSRNDNMIITINPAATVNAGLDAEVCSSAPNVTLAGSFGGGATSATWSGGAGTFNPNANTLNAVYTPSAAEITAGTVTLTLTTNDPTGPCPSVNDNMTITINANPGKPALSFVYPDCNRAQMQITVTSPTGSKIEYRNQGGAWQSSPVFNVAPGIGYSIEARNTDHPECISASADCPAPQARQVSPEKTEPTKKAEVEKAELQVYPNPFTMNSTLQFKVVKAGRAVVEVFDLNGRLVNRVYSAQVEAGIPYQVSLDGSKYADGVYFTRLTVDGQLVKSLRIVHNK